LQCWMKQVCVFLMMAQLQDFLDQIKARAVLTLPFAHPPWPLYWNGSDWI